MFFKEGTAFREIQDWIAVQLPAVYQVAKHGIDVEIKPHKKLRTIQQNRFLYAVLVALVKFHNETGFIPKYCGEYNMDVESLKTSYKKRFGINKSSKIDTVAFGKFIDQIQLSLVEETGGEWEIIQPDSAYIDSLLAEGGY